MTRKTIIDSKNGFDLIETHDSNKPYKVYYGFKDLSLGESAHGVVVKGEFDDIDEARKFFETISAHVS